MAASSRTIQELLTVTPAPKKITSTLIRNLRPGIDYRMSSHSLAQVHQIYPEISSYVSFQFDINIKEKITFFDPLSCTYKIQGEDDKTFFFSINQEGVFCVSQKTLPVCFRDIDFPMMHYYGDPWELFFITSYKLVVNEETVSQSASRGTLDIQSRPLYTLNEFLRIEYSRQLGSGIKVHTTEYPIFKSCNPFSKDELNKLFNKFITNNQDLLRSQYKVTKNKCHIRAHFINYCLREYGIDSYKIFKFWEVDDWQLYEDNKSWTFHCAALIRDNEGNDWIWDPWEASATELVSLRDWTIRTGQPIPKAVMITPGFMACFPYCPITTKTTCATIPSSRYPLISTDEMKENPNDLRAFQAMHASVVRLPIEKNFGNPYRLFQPEPRELKLLKYSPAMTESSCPEHSTASCSRP